MPVTFAPADPFSAAIASQYGQTEQFDKTLPTLANLSIQNARLQQEGAQHAMDLSQRTSAQSAENFTRGGIARDENQLRDVQQVRQIQNERQMQQQRIQASHDSQQADQAYHAAMQDRQWSYADQIKDQEMHNALTAINEAVENGTLTPEEAGETALKLRTKVDVNKMRQEKAQAEYQQAHAKQVLEQTGLQTAVLKKNLEMQARDVTENAILDPRAKLLAERQLRPQAQAMAAVMGEAAATDWLNKAVREKVVESGNYTTPTGISSHGTLEIDHTKGKPGQQQKAEEREAGGDWSHLGTQGRYDEKKGLADAKAFAESEYPKEMESSTVDGKTVKVDKNEEKRNDLIRRRVEGTRREFNQALKGGSANVAAGPQDASGQAQTANDQRDQPAASAPKPIAPEVIQTTAKSRLEQADKLNVPTPVKERLNSSIRTLESMMRDKPFAEHTPEEQQYMQQLKQFIDGTFADPPSSKPYKTVLRGGS